MAFITMNFARRFGVVGRQPARSLVLWLSDPALLATATTLARLIHERYPRTPVLFVQAPGRAPVPGFPSFDAPHRLPFAAPLLLKRLRTQTLVLVGQPLMGSLDPLPAAHARGASLILLQAESTVTAKIEDARLDAALHAGELPVSPQDPRMALFDRLITRSRKTTMKARGRLPLESRLLRQPLARALLRLKFRPYGSIATLREALGCPATILCLGNGPSSELPELLSLPHDCLFRVNLSWQARGLLTSPDLVFTGLPEAIDALRPPVGFVFGTIASEEKLLGRVALSARRLRYATAERLRLFPRESEAGLAPTNGALMIATAVALQPARLVIAGIDLYTHPAGAYPGDGATANAYAAGHDAKLELHFMLDALRRYRGELVILSEALRLAHAAQGDPRAAESQEN